MKRMQCPNCQSWIDQDDASCGFCGHILDQGTSTPESGTVQQTPAVPSIIQAAPQPEQPVSSQASPPNLPPSPLVTQPKAAVSVPPPQQQPQPQQKINTVPSPPSQAAQFEGKNRKGGSCFKIGCGITAILGFCLLLSGAIGFFFFLPAAMPIDIPLVDQVPVVIENYLDTSICYLNVSPSDSDDWGFDLLGTSDIIEPGYAYTVYVLPAQTYDIQILDCDSNALDTIEGVKIDSGGYTYSPGSE